MQTQARHCKSIPKDYSKCSPASSAGQPNAVDTTDVTSCKRMRLPWRRMMRGGDDTRDDVDDVVVDNLDHVDAPSPFATCDGLTINRVEWEDEHDDKHMEEGESHSPRQHQHRPVKRFVNHVRGYLYSRRRRQHWAWQEERSNDPTEFALSNQLSESQHGPPDFSRYDNSDLDKLADWHNEYYDDAVTVEISEENSTVFSETPPSRPATRGKHWEKVRGFIKNRMNAMQDQAKKVGGGRSRVGGDSWAVMTPRSHRDGGAASLPNARQYEEFVDQNQRSFEEGELGSQASMEKVVFQHKPSCTGTELTMILEEDEAAEEEEPFQFVVLKTRVIC